LSIADDTGVTAAKAPPAMEMAPAPAAAAINRMNIPILLIPDS
jgi:hypothetical protein